jgi:chemotaxis protein CheD
MGNTFNVGLGEQVISRSSGDILVAYGLGSCLGIGMFDPITHVTGLLHAVLPEHSASNGATPGKYVDSGIVSLLEDMIKAGADRRRMIVRMAGGANMLLSPGMTKAFDIGNRNISMAHKIFESLNIRLAAIEVGGNTGRTVRLYVTDGRMTVRMVGQQEHDITAVRGAGFNEIRS